MRAPTAAFSALLIPAAALAMRFPLPAPYAENLRRRPADQVCKAAQALVRAQGDFRTDDGAVLLSTWEWRRGSGLAASNAAGLVAGALARSAAAAPGCATAEALTHFAEARIAEHARGDILFDPDVEALALSAGVLGQPRYRDAARAAFDRRYHGATGREIVERGFFLQRSPPILGYDAALAIRAGTATGAIAKAIEIADAALAALPRWGEGDDAQGLLTTSRGALLDALMRLDARRYAKPARDLVHHLVLGQASDGSWSARNTQATAYAVLGLMGAGDGDAAAAARRGQRWLHVTQLRDGSWARFNDLMPEPFVGDVIPTVTAEAMLALAAR